MQIEIAKNPIVLSLLMSSTSAPALLGPDFVQSSSIKALAVSDAAFAFRRWVEPHGPPTEATIDHVYEEAAQAGQRMGQQGMSEALRLSYIHEFHDELSRLIGDLN